MLQPCIVSLVLLSNNNKISKEMSKASQWCLQWPFVYWFKWSSNQNCHVGGFDLLAKLFLSSLYLFLRTRAIETPPRPVPAGPLISWPKNASCSWIPPQASRTSLPPRRWATTSCRLSLRPCTAPPSCSLQSLLKLSLLSLRPSLLQFVSIVSLCWITEIWSLSLCVCFNLLFFCQAAFTFLIEMNFSFKTLFAIWSLSPQDSTITFNLV